jgi:hypothetical protein
VLAVTTAAGLRMSTTSQCDTRYEPNHRMEWPQRRAAQRSDALHLAMRHVSALQSSPVGGDWCDVFVQAEGHTLVTAVSWQLVFFTNVPLTAAVVLMTARHVPESRARTGHGPLAVCPSRRPLSMP